MSRRIEADVLYRGVITYTRNPDFPKYQPGTDMNEVFTSHIGPYASLSTCKRFTRKDMNSYWYQRGGMFRLIDVRYEKVTGWETTDYELIIP